MGVPKNVPLSHKKLGLVREKGDKLHENNYLFTGHEVYIGQVAFFGTPDKSTMLCLFVPWSLQRIVPLSHKTFFGTLNNSDGDYKNGRPLFSTKIP